MATCRTAKYQSKIKTGETFVYYRGVYRVGGKRGAAEYVGAGRVGHIWPDPNADRKSRRAFFRGIEDYQRFAVPVSAKANGVTLEQIPAGRQNLWLDGVRALDQITYDQILQQGMVTRLSPSSAPQLSEASIAESDALIVPAAMIEAGSGKSGTGIYRKSKRAKEIGDWAEKVAVRYIRERVAGCTDCVHRAAIDETPGWILTISTSTGSCSVSKGKEPSRQWLTGQTTGYIWLQVALQPRRRSKRYKTPQASCTLGNGLRRQRSIH
jgi:hypothetical protein